jgi:hypothetical protein
MAARQAVSSGTVETQEVDGRERVGAATWKCESFALNHRPPRPGIEARATVLSQLIDLSQYFAEIRAWSLARVGARY